MTSAPAHAYRTSADLAELSDVDQERVVWDALPARVELHFAPDAPLDLVETELALVEATNIWNATPCYAPLLTYAAISGDAASAGDGRNTIQWITSGWSDVAPSDAAAATDVQFELSESTGLWEIVEADIYLNGQSVKWGVSSDDPEQGRDLVAVLTHELGHVLGLAHPCEPDGADGAPDCADADLPPAAMHPLYDARRIVLQPDDLQGLCSLYRPSDCADGACLPTPPERCEGDECTADVDPDVLECVRDGRCPVSCLTGPCAAAVLLTDAGLVDHVADAGCDADAGACPSAPVDRDAGLPGLFGESCESPEHCVDGRCLAGATESGDGLCTRACGDDAAAAACPAGWSCKSVEGEAVCAPEPESDGGCSAQPGRAPGATTPLIPFLAALLYWRRPLHRRARASLPTSRGHHG